MWLYLFSAWLVLSSCGGTRCSLGKGAHQQDCSSPAPKASSKFQPGAKVISKYFDPGAATQKAHLISLQHLISLGLGLCTGPQAPSCCILCSGGKRRYCPLLDLEKYMMGNKCFHHPQVRVEGKSLAKYPAPTGRVGGQIKRFLFSKTPFFILLCVWVLAFGVSSGGTGAFSH